MDFALDSWQRAAIDAISWEQKGDRKLMDIAAPRFAAAYKTREAALAAKEDITRILLLGYSGEKRATQADDYVRKRTRHDPPHTADEKAKVVARRKVYSSVERDFGRLLDYAFGASTPPPVRGAEEAWARAAAIAEEAGNDQLASLLGGD